MRDTACCVNVDYGLSKCDLSEAVVSVVFSSDNTELLTNGSLVVNTRNARLTLDDDTFCVDSVVNSSDSVLVKFCQSVSTVCREGPCVQKCCPDGYGMIESRSCRPSGLDFNPQFYNRVATKNVLEHVAITIPSFAILSHHPHLTKPTHTHTHTLQKPHIHTRTHHKTHTYTHPHITKLTHTHTHALQNPHLHTPTHYKTS